MNKKYIPLAERPDDQLNDYEKWQKHNDKIYEWQKAYQKKFDMRMIAGIVMFLGGLVFIPLWGLLGLSAIVWRLIVKLIRIYLILMTRRMHMEGSWLKRIRNRVPPNTV
jgi:hypothetical protein